MGRNKLSEDLPYDTEMIYLIQEGRQSEFPSDRIAFFRDVLAKDDSTKEAVWRIAEKDIQCFNDYETGAITMDILCMRVAKNSFLDRYFKGKGIPKEMMLNELKLMGYGRDEGHV